MTFPSPSDFTSSANDSVWWLVRHTDASGKYFWTRCRTDGITFVGLLQSMLKQEIPATGYRTYDGTSVLPRSIVVDGKIGPVTIKAAWALLNRLGGPPVYLTLLAALPAAHTVGRAGVLALLWLMTRVNFGSEWGQGVALPLDAIYVDPASVWPRWAPSTTARPPALTGLDLRDCAIDPGLGMGSTPILTNPTSTLPPLVLDPIADDSPPNPDPPPPVPPVPTPNPDHTIDPVRTPPPALVKTSSNAVPIVAAVVLAVGATAGLVWFLRTQPKKKKGT